MAVEDLRSGSPENLLIGRRGHNLRERREEPQPAFGLGFTWGGVLEMTGRGCWGLAPETSILGVKLHVLFSCTGVEFRRRPQRGLSGMPSRNVGRTSAMGKGAAGAVGWQCSAAPPTLQEAPV